MKEELVGWTKDALEELGGSGTIVEVARHVWRNHEADLRNAGDFFFTWQYDLRWAAWTLRQRGLMDPASEGERGVWTLSAGAAGTTKASPNPVWARDELILALEIYLRRGNLNSRDQEVRMLSEELRAMDIHPESSDESFRSPASVNRKLGNFAALDPDFPGAGLEAVGRADRAVFAEFANDSDALRRAAEEVRQRNKVD